MASTYPGTIDSFTNPAGTNTLASPDHAGQHSDINDAVENMQSVMGTNSGTSVLKNFTAGQFAVSQSGTAVLTSKDLSSSTNSFPSTLGRKLYTTVGTVVGESDYVCDGTADEVQIQQALTYVGTIGGGVVYIKKGTYNFATAGSIVWDNVDILGEPGVTLKCITNNDYVLQVGIRSGTVKACENNVIDGVTFDGGYSGIDEGAGLDASACDNLTIQNCVFQNFYGQRGLRVQTWSDTEYVKRNVKIVHNTFKNASIVLGGINGGCLSENYFLGGQEGAVTQDSLVDVSYAEQDSAVVYNFVISHNQFLEIQPTTSTSILAGFEQVENVIISDNVFDNIKGNCINIRSDLVTSLQNLIIEDNIANTCYAFLISNGTNANITGRIHVNGNILRNSRNMMLQPPNNTSLYGNYVENTDTIANGGFDRGPFFIYNVGNIRIENNYVRDTQGTVTTPYFVWIEGAGTVQLINNHSQGTYASGGAAYRTAGSNSNIRVRNNVGIVTEANGSVTVANGKTLGTVAHGLSLTPSVYDFSLSPANSLGSATKYFVSSVDATNLVVGVNTDPGATTGTIAWKATIL